MLVMGRQVRHPGQVEAASVRPQLQATWPPRRGSGRNSGQRAGHRQDRPVVGGLGRALWKHTAS